MVSKHVYASWGKDIGARIKEELPDGAVIMEQQGNFERAGLDLLIYHENFEVVPLGQNVPAVILDIPLNTEAKTKLIFNH